MSLKTVHGFAWFVCPDTFGLESDEVEVKDPGQPFGSNDGAMQMPPEVLFFRPIDPNDAGIRNEKRGHSYLVLTKLQLHPRLNSGWEAEPAGLTDKFKTSDGQVKMAKMVQVHRRHVGELLECELSFEGESVAVSHPA